MFVCCCCCDLAVQERVGKGLFHKPSGEEDGDSDKDGSVLLQLSGQALSSDHSALQDGLGTPSPHSQRAAAATQVSWRGQGEDAYASDYADSDPEDDNARQESDWEKVWQKEKQEERGQVVAQSESLLFSFFFSFNFWVFCASMDALQECLDILQSQRQAEREWRGAETSEEEEEEKNEAAANSDLEYGNSTH